MLLYILQVSFIWLVLYLFYAFFLQKEHNFQLNRTYLLFSLLAGLSFPLIQIKTSNYALGLFPVWLNEITVGANQQFESPTHETSSWTYASILLLGYAIGLLLSTLRFLSSLLQIKILYAGAFIEKHASYSLVKTKEIHSPFSFGKYLFISSKIPLSSKEYHYILQHEQAHIIQHHSLDILLLELLGILFWFNPLLFFYKTALRDQHEYLADKAALNHANIKEYGQLLIEQSIPGLKIGLVNHLIYSQLKKRINMMTTKKQSSKMPYLRYACSISAILLVFWTVSCQKDVNSQVEELTIAKEELKDMTKTDDEVIVIAEEMPRFPGCEDMAGDNKVKKACSDQKLLQFIYKNVKYPAEAKAKNIEGMAVVSFVVSKEGTLKDIKLLRDPKGGCGSEAIRIINLMNEQNIRWRPGINEGKIVAVKYNLPIRFKLQ